MKATELRIGNFVKFQGEIIEIDGIDKFNIHWGNGNFAPITINGFFQPIRLTEECHNKFGTFKNGFKSFEYVLPRKNNISLTVIFTGDYVMLRQGQGTSGDDVVSIWNKDLTKRDMYVHEWQNLYFCLSGEELTIKE
jgi:hypothetical protein